MKQTVEYGAHKSDETTQQSEYPWCPKTLGKASFFLATALLLFYTLLWTNYLEDDCFIYLRYALNFVSGHGWVMNIGERVEGCTSPLMLWIYTALLRYVGPDTAITCVKFLGLMCGLRLLWLTRILARTLLPEIPGAGDLAILLVALRPEFTLALTDGMETAFAALCLLSGVLAWTRLAATKTPETESFLPVGLWFGAAALLRPEMTLMLPALTVIHALVRRRLVWKPLLIFAAILAALLAWRLSYYQSFLPNTYFAKRATFGDLERRLPQGLQYLQDYALPFQIGVPLVSVVLAALVVFRGAGRLIARRTWEPVLIVLVQMPFAVAVGGDWMLSGRFLTGILPLLALIWAAGIFAFWDRIRKYTIPLARREALHLALVLLIGSLLYMDIYGRVRLITKQTNLRGVVQTAQEHRLYERWAPALPGGRRILADWVRNHVPSGGTVACPEMGLAPILNMDKRFVDVLGLTDAIIARMPDYPRSRVGVVTESQDWGNSSTPIGSYLLSRHCDAVVLIATEQQPVRGYLTTDRLKVDLEWHYGTSFVTWVRSPGTETAHRIAGKNEGTSKAVIR